MNNWTINDIFKIVGMFVCWGIAILLGLTVFLTVAEGVIAFASTGLGTVIILIAGWRLYTEYKKNKQ